MAAGLCQAAVEALSKGISGTHGKMFHMLGTFFAILSDDLHPAAMAVLVDGGVLELAVSRMAEGLADTAEKEIAILIVFLGDPLSRERMCTPKLVDPLTRGISKWLFKVRNC
jgi:hypothetical protein